MSDEPNKPSGGRCGIVYGSLSYTRRLRANRDGRVLLIGLLMIVVPLVLRDAIIRVILTLPQPALSRVYHFVDRNSNWHEPLAIAFMIVGLGMMTFACIRRAWTVARRD